MYYYYFYVLYELLLLSLLLSSRFYQLCAMCNLQFFEIPRVYQMQYCLSVDVELCLEWNCD